MLLGAYPLSLLLWAVNNTHPFVLVAADPGFNSIAMFLVVLPLSLVLTPCLVRELFTSLVEAHVRLTRYDRLLGVSDQARTKSA